jgi:beta-lactamase superfamily II metal-dependent hydrolase
LDKEFGIGEVIASSFRFRSVAYRRIFSEMQRAPNRLRNVHRSDIVGPWQVLHPTASDNATQADDGALVTTGEFNGTRILLLSDLGRTGQNFLFDRTPDLRADIVITGIPTQSEPINDALLDAIKPRLIIVADPEVPATERAKIQLQDRLALRNVQVLYTRLTGAITILLTPTGCTVQPMNAPGVTLPVRPADETQR